MILYHGSCLPIPNPDLNHSRANLDFGCGFYTTPIYEQAARWCARFKRRGKDGVISIYNFDEKVYSLLKILKFEDYSPEWLDFILSCRSGRDNSNFDIVDGGIADDRVFNTVELYFDGLIDKYEAIKRLRYEVANRQICFRSTTSLRFLHYEGSEQL